jgi:hypothetical protein
MTDMFKANIMKVKNKKISIFEDFLELFPLELKERILNLKNVEQRLDYHPEGNCLNHIKIVFNRCLKFNDLNLLFISMFHDVGKDKTSIKNEAGLIQSAGHEDISADLVWEYRAFIQDLGGDWRAIHEVVLYHMRIKPWDSMNKGTQNKLRELKNFDLLWKFSKSDLMLLPEEDFDRFVKSIKLNEIFGIWKDTDITIEKIRQKVWPNKFEES